LAFPFASSPLFLFADGTFRLFRACLCSALQSVLRDYESTVYLSSFLSWFPLFSSGIIFSSAASPSLHSFNRVVALHPVHPRPSLNGPCVQAVARVFGVIVLSTTFTPPACADTLRALGETSSSFLMLRRSHKSLTTFPKCRSLWSLRSLFEVKLDFLPRDSADHFFPRRAELGGNVLSIFPPSRSEAFPSCAPLHFCSHRDT